MINANRIVPIQAVDLISMYGLILVQASANSGLVALTGATVEGDFEVGASAGSKLIANEPVKTLDFASGYTAGTVFFVPAYDYVGFSINGVAEEPADGSDDVVADGKTLYKAVLSSGDITITKVGF